MPSPSLFWTSFWYFPGTFAYHMLYMKQLMTSNYQVAVSGPSLLRKKTIREEYPGFKALHN